MLSTFLLPASPQKDTVLITLTVLGRAGHVQENQSRIVGACDNDFIELHGSVHAPHIGLVPVGNAADHGPHPWLTHRAHLPPSDLHLQARKWLGLLLLHSRLNMHQFSEVVRDVAGVPGLSCHILVPCPCHLDLVSPSCRLILLI